MKLNMEDGEPCFRFCDPCWQENKDYFSAVNRWLINCSDMYTIYCHKPVYVEMIHFIGKFHGVYKIWYGFKICSYILSTAPFTVS